MKFLYAYKTSDGTRHEDEIESESREAAFAALREKGIRPIKVYTANGSKANGETKFITRKRFVVAALIAGLTSSNLSTLGNALIVGSRSSMSSDWSKVRSVQCFPRRGVIKVNELLNKNQVYASKEDFEFVRDYIISHCVNAKIK